MEKTQGYKEMGILEEICEIPISDTQKIRVLVVKDSMNRVRTSLQKWWRPDTKSDWRVGKGFLLNLEDTSTIGHALLDSEFSFKQHLQPQK